MNLNSGTRRNSSRGSRPGAKKSLGREGGRTAAKSKQSKRGKQSKKMTMPKTAVIQSRKSADRMKFSRASSGMSLTELQFLAKDRGIPFGGLSRAKLAKKINNYMY
jgi:hypothetical protein